MPHLQASYFFGGHYLAFGETSSSLPPYLNTVVLLATVGIALVLSRRRRC